MNLTQRYGALQRWRLQQARLKGGADDLVAPERNRAERRRAARLTRRRGR